MQMPHLYANSYQKRMESGRTKPCLFFCGDEAGDINGEYVVKLKAGIETSETGLSCELIASQLAMLLGIPTPEPAIIKIDMALADAVNDTELATKIRDSVGLNFGSNFLAGGYETWPIGMAIPATLRQLAGEIFAFDSLIQNPDRKVERPNLLWKGEEIYIFDHEMGFSFIFDILSPTSPWQITGLKFLSDHVFYRGLKGQTLNLDRLVGAMEGITETQLNELFANIPRGWNSPHIGKIKKHLNEITNHVNDFIDEVRRVLQ